MTDKTTFEPKQIAIQAPAFGYCGELSSTSCDSELKPAGDNELCRGHVLVIPPGECNCRGGGQVACL